MTREEAIKRFQRMKKIFFIPNSDAERTIEAIDMAITETEPTDTDLISRADAIKAVEQEYKIDRGYMVDDYTYGFNQAIHYVSDIILQGLPSADAVRSEADSVCGR